MFLNFFGVVCIKCLYCCDGDRKWFRILGYWGVGFFFFWIVDLINFGMFFFW